MSFSSLPRSVALVALVAGAGSYARAGAAQTPPPVDTFEIRLHRRATVGARARVTVESARHQTVHTTSGGQVLSDHVDELRVHFRAVERVVAVTPDGRIRQAEYVIERFGSDDAQGAHVLARRGQVLSMTRGARRSELVATIDGLPLQPTTRVALGLVLSSSNGGATDDEAFGTTARQAVGASWPMNAEVVQRDFAQNIGGAATLSGQTRLERRATVRRVPCLELVTTMNGTLTEMPGIPAGTTVRAGTLRVTVHETLPVETTLPGVSSATDTTMDVTLDVSSTGGRPYGSGQVQLNNHETRTESDEPLGG